MHPSLHRAWLRLKSALVRTRLEAPAKRLQDLSFLLHRWKHPELREIYAEAQRMDRNVNRIVTADMNCVDVEEAEPLVLKGARETTRQCVPFILFESQPQGSELSGVPRKTFFEFITDELEYSIVFLKDYLDGGPAADWERFDAAHRYSLQAFDYVATPNAAAQEGQSDRCCSTH